MVKGEKYIENYKKPRKNNNGEIVFPDYPEFRPNLTREVLEEHIGDLFILKSLVKIMKISIKNILIVGGKEYH